MPDTRLKRCLDALAEGYGPSYLHTDPVSLLHRYRDHVDCEVAGLVTASLAYGGAGQIIRSAGDALDRLGPHPGRRARNLGETEATALFHGFVHRWTRGEDLAALVMAVSRAIRSHGSLGEFVRSLNNPAEPDIGGLLARFAAGLASFAPPYPPGQSPRRTTITSHRARVPSPSDGSACKRPVLFFRWMVRGPDGIDLGLWPWIGAHRLVIPLDRHAARIARAIGLTRCVTPDWRMVLDVTASLRRFDPVDPVRYDFALVRPGITRACAEAACAGCVLRGFCREAR